MENQPIALASVTQVSGAEFDDGRVGALELQRPTAEAQVERALASVLGPVW